MKGVKPVKQNLADLGKPRRVKDINHQARRLAATSESSSLTDLGISDWQVRPVNPGENLLFHVPDLPLRTLQALRKGLLTWQEGLDLHGFTIEKSRAALSEFIRDGSQIASRCLLLVHGKSYNREGEVPSIKSHVNVWLRQMPEVLAFCSALPKDGGSGALYILLRTRTHKHKNLNH
ncbi:MAG: DNA mismatch repair protein MutS [Pseudomonadaceae bacterium]|nr:DNA mismatch repair protein MutS [Pseudomonadaceae bacterium]